MDIREILVILIIAFLAVIHFYISLNQMPIFLYFQFITDKYVCRRLMYNIKNTFVIISIVKMNKTN